MLSPFASQLYQMPSDLQVQFEGSSASPEGVNEAMSGAIRQVSLGICEELLDMSDG